MARISDFAAGTAGTDRMELARRRSRYKYAVDRAVKMADGTPRFTDDELAGLAGIFLSRRTGAQAEEERAEVVA